MERERELAARAPDTAGRCNLPTGLRAFSHAPQSASFDERFRKVLTGDFLYDVAFSFLAKDEPLARRLHESVRTRVKSFIYSDAERQTQIAGQDGGDALGRIYGEQ